MPDDRSYSVQYEPAATASLTSAWTVAVDRNAVTAAVEDAEKRLRRNPGDCDREVGEGLLALDIGPISVAYSLVEGSREVTVHSVRLLMPPRGGNGRPPTRKV